jgi:hypothetical protein
MLTTRTGNFPIGFRRGWSEWQQDLPALTQWARGNGFGLIDLGTSTADMSLVLEAGLSIGSMDLAGLVVSFFRRLRQASLGNRAQRGLHPRVRRCRYQELLRGRAP